MWYQLKVWWTRAVWRVVLFSDECLVFSCYLLMDAHVSTDAVGIIMLQTVRNQSTNLLVAVSVCGLESIVGRLLCMWQVHWQARSLDEIMQHRVIPHMQLNGGLFQHDKASPCAARGSHECLQRHTIPHYDPTEHLRDALEQDVRLMNQSPKTLPQLITVLKHTYQNVHVLCNVRLLQCVVVVKQSSGLVVVKTDNDILPSAMYVSGGFPEVMFSTCTM